ncbi:MAG TPA: carbohydrate ABC transporter permease [Chloroflexota bacterium]|nr:carbohydrate ABC transporter permease [Chloroflexota bacterium]
MAQLADTVAPTPGQPAAAAVATPLAAPIDRVRVDATEQTERSPLARILMHIALLLGALASVFPFYWMLITSLKSNSEAIAQPPTFWPREWVLQNYALAWNAAPFGRYFLNTMVITLCTVVGVVVVSTLAAYPFARMRFAGKNIVFAALLATMMIPADITVIPNFIIVTKWLGWYNTYQAQVVPYVGSVFAIFLLRQFFMTVPKELEEAALIDGCSRLRFLWAILVPLSIPALITVALLNFLGSWNAFLWPLLVTSAPEMRPIQLGLIVFQSDAGARYAELMAASTMVIMPTVLVFLVAQKYFVEGIARTGLKG